MTGTSTNKMKPLSGSWTFITFRLALYQAYRRRIAVKALIEWRCALHMMHVLADSLLANDVLKFNGAAEAEGGFNVRSGRGGDTLRGGGGADRLWGNEGADTLTGGAGKDVFEYASTTESTNAQRDLIRDFERGDMLSLGAIDADGSGVAGNGSFLFVGAAAFSGRAGELRLLQNGTNAWLVEGDTNGDRIADLSIAVLTPGGYQMSAVDFQF